MKDLKHLIFFEDLLQEANNALVQKAKADGKFAIVYTIGVASPLISETATTETYYLGEVKNVKIDKDITTQITVNVKLTEFQKAMNPL